jgi:hypothetical protein
VSELEDRLHALVGCQWGQLLHTPDMPKRCTEQAVQIVRLYDTPLGTIELRLCQLHLDRIEAETTPHVMD